MSSSGILFLQRKAITARKLSSVALAALTVFTSARTGTSWTFGGNHETFKNLSSSSSITASSSKSTTNISRAMSSSASDTCESTFAVAQFPCLSDNYGYLIHDPKTGNTAAIDTPSAETYKKELEKRGWKLTHILNTHHHSDHAGGNYDLKTDGVTIYGPATESIPGMDFPLKGGDSVEIGNLKATVMDVGGHTEGHIAYHFPDQSLAFVGDSLFKLGCGRMFEGTPTQFWASLKRIRDLPDDTLVYCAHEYTLSNAKFAISVEPNNQDLIDQIAIAKAKRERGEPTVPSLISEEKKANPFLRVDCSEEIRKNVKVTDQDTEAEAFAKVRKAKDNF